MKSKGATTPPDNVIIFFKNSIRFIRLECLLSRVSFWICWIRVCACSSTRRLLPLPSIPSLVSFLFLISILHSVAAGYRVIGNIHSVRNQIKTRLYNPGFSLVLPRGPLSYRPHIFKQLGEPGGALHRMHSFPFTRRGLLTNGTFDLYIEKKFHLILLEKPNINQS